MSYFAYTQVRRYLMIITLIGNNYLCARNCDCSFTFVKTTLSLITVMVKLDGFILMTRGNFYYLLHIKEILFIGRDDPSYK